MLIKADCRFVDVVIDRGVPTPRFEVVLPDGLDISKLTVHHLSATHIPPGTILMFPQAGNSQSNAERIVEQSRRAAQIAKLTLRRSDD